MVNAKSFSTPFDNVIAISVDTKVAVQEDVIKGNTPAGELTV